MCNIDKADRVTKTDIADMTMTKWLIIVDIADFDTKN